MKKFLRYLIAYLIGAALTLVLCGVRGAFGTTLDKVELMRCLCDAFFVSAAVLMCLGALMWAGRQGIFNGLSYSVSTLFDIHRPAKGEWHRKETYAEYKERVHDKVKNRPYAFLLVVGMGYLVPSIAFLIAYHAI